MRQRQEPEVETKDGSLGGTILRHPSFGMARFSRVSGHNDCLFGSSIENQNYVTFTISRGEVRRDLHCDWYYAGKEIIEIEMSENQFATLITTLNSGSGVPVTIGHENGKIIPQCPPRNRRAELKDEFKERMNQCRDNVDEMQKKLQELQVPGRAIKKSDIVELSRLLSHASAEIKGNAVFCHEQFDEACDKTVAEAKSEIDAAFTNLIGRLGCAKLQEMVGMDSAPAVALIEQKE